METIRGFWKKKTDFYQVKASVSNGGVQAEDTGTAFYN